MFWLIWQDEVAPRRWWDFLPGAAPRGIIKKVTVLTTTQNSTWSVGVRTTATGTLVVVMRPLPVRVGWNRCHVLHLVGTNHHVERGLVELCTHREGHMGFIQGKIVRFRHCERRLRFWSFTFCGIRQTKKTWWQSSRRYCLVNNWPSKVYNYENPCVGLSQQETHDSHPRAKRSPQFKQDGDPGPPLFPSSLE